MGMSFMSILQAIRVCTILTQAVEKKQCLIVSWAHISPKKHESLAASLHSVLLGPALVSGNLAIWY